MNKTVLIVDYFEHGAPLTLRTLAASNIVNPVLVARTAEEALETLNCLSVREEDKHVGVILMELQSP